ncbi:MAG: ribonuclease HII [Chloroflexi bacterium]|nr:ribonuclease HII [Chloroflexota bacterium]
MASTLASRADRSAGSRAGLALEAELWQAGYRLVAGADEAGRGAWAGPLVAAAVILPADGQALAPLLSRVDDSKRLTPARRSELYDAIHQCAVAVAVTLVSADEIDRIGILAANRLAIVSAATGLAAPPDFLLVDFLTLPGCAIPQRGIAHGDALSLTIAAASIIAKVTRDRWMAQQEAIYPDYGFAQHKGYGTAAHRAALRRLGPCPLHRLSFGPLRAYVC